MSKQQFKIEDFGHVNEALIKRIESVIADRKASRLSSSAIYKAHNELFKLREPIQTCQSCLVVRGDKIGKWYDWYVQQAAPQTPQIQIPVVNNGTGEGPAVQATHDLEDGRVLTVLADGTVKVGEEAVTDGAYVRTDGVALAVFEGQLIVNPEGGDEHKPQLIFTLADGRQLITTADGIAMIGEEAAPEGPYPLADGSTIVVGVDGKLVDTTQISTEETKAPQIILQKVNKDTYVAEGEPFFGIFTESADDATKGVVVVAETGKAVAAGTYATEDVKQVLSVQPGGKASYKAV